MNKDSQKTIRTSVILTGETHIQIADLATKNEVSTAWILWYALNEFLETYSDGKGLKVKPKYKAKLFRGIIL